MDGDTIDFSRYIRLATGRYLAEYAKHARVDLLDPNASGQSQLMFQKYPREKVLKFLQEPAKNSVKIIDASNYLFSMSPHYRRLCGYFAYMLTFDYIMLPVGRLGDIDGKQFLTDYEKALGLLELMQIRQTFGNMALVVVREGAFFGYEVKTADSYMIHRFPHTVCKVTSWEDGCPLFSLDMSYFNKNQPLLMSLGSDMQTLYNRYKADNKKKWAELDSGASVCILADETLPYVVPMFSGTFTDIYGIQDYKDLAVTKEEQDLYKLIALKFPMNKDTGAFLMEEPIAAKFYEQMAFQLPEHIGLTLNPFEMKEVQFPQSSPERDSTAVAERNFWDAAGVSSLLFNNVKSSGAALQESVVNDMTLMLPVLRSLERWTNKRLKNLPGSSRFKAVFLDVSHYTRRRTLEAVRKDEQYGAPLKTALCALYGYSPGDMMAAAFLENDVLKLTEKFIPPKSAHTQGEVGRPTNESIGVPLSESGALTAESGANDNRAEE